MQVCWHISAFAPDPTYHSPSHQGVGESRHQTWAIDDLDPTDDEVTRGRKAPVFPAESIASASPFLTACAAKTMLACFFRQIARELAHHLGPAFSSVNDGCPFSCCQVLAILASSPYKMTQYP